MSPGGISWVLLDETEGRMTSRGETLSYASLLLIAEALTTQQARDVIPTNGGFPMVFRAGLSASDIRPGERLMVAKNTLPEAPGAVAYHSDDGHGVPFMMLAISETETVLGAGDSVSGAFSHEANETEGDPGINLWADMGNGYEMALEWSDAIETNSYPIEVSSGEKVYVSDFCLRAFFTPGAPGPYTFMQAMRMQGNFPTGPFQIASANGGNYGTIRPTSGNGTQVFAEHAKKGVIGTPRRRPHWSSRRARRLEQVR